LKEKQNARKKLQQRKTKKLMQNEGHSKIEEQEKTTCSKGKFMRKKVARDMGKPRG